MSATTSPDATQFELIAAYDRPEDPSEVTLFPTGGDDAATRWLTIDVDHAVALSDAV